MFKTRKKIPQILHFARLKKQSYHAFFKKLHTLLRSLIPQILLGIHLKQFYYPYPSVLRLITCFSLKLFTLILN